MCTNECGFGYKKCSKCYWQDNCPLHEMTEEEIKCMKDGGRVQEDDYANFDNCRSYFNEYCEYYTPFDDSELGIVEYERELKERQDLYDELLDELNN